MVKKVGESSISKKATKSNSLSAIQREQILIDNFIGLQRAMTNLSIRFEHLSENIAKLLTVFEISAKDYLTNKGKSTPGRDQDLLNQINYLIDQNKAISKSIANIDNQQKSVPQPVDNSMRMSSPQPTMSPGPQGYQQSNPGMFKAKPLQSV